MNDTLIVGIIGGFVSVIMSLFFGFLFKKLLSVTEQVSAQLTRIALIEKDVAQIMVSMREHREEARITASDLKKGHAQIIQVLLKQGIERRGAGGETLPLSD